ncbi:hypothetical protein [Corynebacterium otitidis]|uniref:Uncharacterized protein n=1 Tax=Corynebacterium otitidis ATCC 51513 TaxID=883169 RepID=I7LCK6_9CORY|nr:hypothetical protein [Corynebacterium otitidis]EJZ81380.1 hypothetical protein HMPREF9719_01690 [Corynebacterium otitidis ATCC 51513]KKO82891.1 hypothetical protein AAV33_09530 [Corynebacterium otitidis]CCI84039.1 hypothetical protein BN46_1317 [Corynebacterium otitidis ATCC 51513]
MAQRGEPWRVVDLGAERVRRARAHRRYTVLLRACVRDRDGATFRQVGIGAEYHVRDLHETLVTCFGLSSVEAGMVWRFAAPTPEGEEPVAGSDEVAAHLFHSGDVLVYHWGLWTIDVESLGTFERSEGTAWARCVGGAGSIAGGGEPDLAAINARLDELPGRDRHP